MAKRQKYRLQVLLRVKLRARQRAEHALAKALMALKEAREKEKELMEEKASIIQQWYACRDEMSQTMAGGGVVNDGTVYVNYLRKLKDEEERKEEEIEEQQKAIERCGEQLKRRRGEYQVAARELQIMEKHKELWAKKVAAALSKEEEKEFDELGTTIHQLRRWRGEGEETQHAFAH